MLCVTLKHDERVKAAACSSASISVTPEHSDTTWKAAL